MNGKQVYLSECPHCRRPSVPMSKFDVWLEALVWGFHGCRMRIGLGACFFDVLQQVFTVLMGGMFASIMLRCFQEDWNLRRHQRLRQSSVSSASSREPVV